MAKILTSLRIDETLVRRAQKVLGAKNKTETVEMSLETVVEMESPTDCDTCLYTDPGPG